MIENVIKQRFEEKLPYYPNTNFLMYEILEDENIELIDLAIEYKEIMCRFAQAVADAKGKLTDTPSKWLSQMT